MNATVLTSRRLHRVPLARHYMWGAAQREKRLVEELRARESKAVAKVDAGCGRETCEEMQLEAEQGVAERGE